MFQGDEIQGRFVPDSLQQMRVLAIDPGERRMGLAVSDELGITAQGLETFDNRRGSFIHFLARLVEEYQVGKVVVGNPLLLSGGESEGSGRARQLAKRVEEELGVEVVLWDERLSSVEAQRVLRGSGAEKGAVDRLSAVLILQSYLDYTRWGGTG